VVKNYSKLWKNKRAKAPKEFDMEIGLLNKKEAIKQKREEELFKEVRIPSLIQEKILEKIQAESTPNYQCTKILRAVPTS